MKKSNFINGALIATICIIFTKIIGLLYVIPFYSIIGEQGGALYGYAYNIYNIFLIISSAGIPLAVSKLTCEYDTLNMHAEKKFMYSYIKKIIYIFSISSFLLCFFGAKQIATFIIGDMTGGNSIQDITLSIKSVSFALLFVPLLSIIRGYMQGHKYIGAPSISQVIEQIFRIIVIIFGSFIAINYFNLPISYGVAIAVFGATVGAVIGYIYLLFKSKLIPKNKVNKELSLNEKKIVKKKLIAYCIPFITVNLSYQLYTSLDMILIIRALDFLNFPAADIEAISSIFTTWGGKLIAIVTSLATGLIVSLIPNMVAAYSKKDTHELNSLFQKTFEVLLIVILPLSVFLSIHSDSVWYVLYGKSIYGPIIFRFLSILAFFEALFIIVGSITQNLNKFKLIYLTIFVGLGLNAILDIPLILLFDKLNIYPYYGAITATIISYSISIMYVIYKLSKDDNIKFKFSYIKKYFFTTFLILIPINLFFANYFNTISSRLNSLLFLIFFAIVSFIIYVIINYRLLNKLLEKDIFEFISSKFRKR